MKQENVLIGEVEVPVIIDRGKEWFPCRIIHRDVLLKSGKKLIGKTQKDKYDKFIKKFKVEFSEHNIQVSNCISKQGLVELLKNSYIGRLTVDQRRSQNHLRKYLGMDLLPEDEQDTKYYKEEWLNELDEYAKDVVNEEMKNDIEWVRRCSKCTNHYPLTNTFFAPDDRANKGFMKLCKICDKGQEYFTHPNVDKNKLRKQSEELYEAMNDDYLPKIYEAYRNGELKRLPEAYGNKESYERIIRDLFDKGEINESNLNQSYLINECRLKGISNYFSIEEIYSMLYGDDFYLYPWKYPKFSFRKIKLTYELAKQIIDNYLKENNLIIEDVLAYDYEKLFKDCRIRRLTNSRTLEFVVYYNDRRYAGYCFRAKSSNYYKNEDSLLFDLKYLIEKDMKLDINKIPLYLTKNVLRKKCLPLYNFIVTNKHGSIYEWVDKLYPDKFIEADFEINAYREEFGSDTEMWIHEILKENFKNVIYNQIHTSRTIEIDGMIPDWLVITDCGTYIVEYFGLYEMRQYGKYKRATEYIDKTHRKIEKYGKLSNYKYLFIYPEDVVDDYKGLREKIIKMKESVEFTMV